MEQKAPSIFINPKFKNAYINPNFLSSSIQKIHINPKFLIKYEAPPLPASQPLPEIVKPSPKPIIKNTKRKLIRVPTTPPISSATSFTIFRPSIQDPAKKQSLIKISNTKLVRASHLIKCQQKENEIIKKATESIIKSKKIQRKVDAKKNVYKLDRRSDPIHKKKKIVSMYTIRRMSSSENLSPRKILVSDRKLLKIGHSNSNNKLISINGIMYKSTNNKLMKSSCSELESSGKQKSNPSEQILFIRGEKFILDASGTKLKRDSENGTLNLSKIVIGGLTYKATQDGSYERHQVISRSSHVKMKSISLLTKDKFKKSNMICPIYRRIGKCLGFVNGRCPKVHDHRYVIVCPNFLKGLCKNEKCLLSHNANLHKMPVCKYYLQGLCSKQSQCLYLHKKLTDDTKLCAEFLKGYCPLADKCNLLHDLPPTEQRDRKKFSIVRMKSKKEPKVQKVTVPSSDIRYKAEDSEPTSSNNVPERKKLGLLPAYIPL